MLANIHVLVVPFVRFVSFVRRVPFLHVGAGLMLVLCGLTLILLTPAYPAQLVAEERMGFVFGFGVGLFVGCMLPILAYLTNMPDKEA